MQLKNIRKEYLNGKLEENDLVSSPFQQFGKWMTLALNSGINEPTAMTLATFGTDGFPQARIVLLKYFDTTAFVFFTNYESEKGRSIAMNQHVGLHFFWPELEKQIRISGIAEKTSPEFSDIYFAQRPHDSNIAAMVARQSSIIASREILDEKFNQLKNSMNKQTLVRPDYWGGYQVIPHRFEFWQGRQNRLHDRIVYEKTTGNWNFIRLAP